MHLRFQWWETLTVPPQPRVATPTERERVRKARFISRLILAILVFASANVLLLLTVHDFSSVQVTVGAILLLLAALVFNRRGDVALAAGLCVTCVIFADTSPILLAHTLDVSLLPTLYFLSLAIVMAGALITPVAAFVVAAITSSVIAGCIYLLPHTVALHAFTQGNVSSVLLPPLILQMLTALVTFFVVRDLNTAIERADRAEEIVALKNEVITLTRTHAQGKQQLEEGIRQLAEVHAQVANGNLSARVSLTSGNVLYAVAVPLNTLLSRAQGWKQERDDVTRQLRILQVRLDQIPPSHRSLLL